jgi:hypothetical protein
MEFSEFWIFSFFIVLPVGFFVGMAFNEWTRHRLEHKARIRMAEDEEMRVQKNTMMRLADGIADCNFHVKNINNRLYTLLEEQKIHKAPNKK